MGRLPGDRPVTGGEVTLVEPKRKRPDRPVRRPSRRALAKRSATPTASSTARSARSTSMGGRVSPRCSRAARHLVVYALRPLELDGESLLDLPLVERRESGSSALVDRRTPDGATLRERSTTASRSLAAVRAAGLEGVVAKRAASRYQPGKRTRDWIKVKTARAPGVRDRRLHAGAGTASVQLGALVLGVFAGRRARLGRKLRHRVHEQEIERLLAQAAAARAQPTSPFKTSPKMPRVRKGRCRVGDARSSSARSSSASGPTTAASGRRSTRGFGRTSPARSVSASVPSSGDRKRREALRLRISTRCSGRTRGSPRATSSATTATSRPFWSPSPQDRPFTMKRYPDGIAGQATSSRRTRPSTCPNGSATPHLSGHLPGRREADDRLSAGQRRARAALDGQHGLHRHERVVLAGRPARPARLRPLRPRSRQTTSASKRPSRSPSSSSRPLDALGLDGFPKTSGSDGIHVLVPLARRATYADTREFAEMIAGALAKAHPGLVTTEWTKAKRRGVLIDANQNGEGKTIASAYSVRPRPAHRCRLRFGGMRSREDLDRSTSPWPRRARARGALRRPFRSLSWQGAPVSRPGH